MKPSRSFILTLIVVGVLLAAVPGSLRDLLHNGPYLFTERFFDDLVARLTGPGKLRFILQPIMAMIIGTRHGIADARANLPNFLSGVAFHAEHRRYLMRSTIAGVRDLVAIAILLDVIAQAIIFHGVHPGAALIVGPVLIAIPYSLARALSNRIYKARKSNESAASAS
jgi:hypothetical protein